MDLNNGISAKKDQLLTFTNKKILKIRFKFRLGLVNLFNMINLFYLSPTS
jgi:hypothetical protein